MWLDFIGTRQKLIVSKYGHVSQQFLNKVSIPKETMHCSNTHCTEAAHRHDINTLYVDIWTALFEASTGCIEKSRGSNNEHMVPGCVIFFPIIAPGMGRFKLFNHRRHEAQKSRSLMRECCNII